MANNNLWESLKVRMTHELVKSAKDYDSEYFMNLESMQTQAYNSLVAFVQTCKPVPKGAKSLVVQIDSFMLTRDDEFMIRVLGNYPDTKVFETKDIFLFKVVGHMEHEETILECGKWHSSLEFFNTSCIYSRCHHKYFNICEIFGNSYECTFTISE